MKKSILYLFILIAAAELVVCWFDLEYRILTKPLVIPVLVIYAAASISLKRNFVFFLALYFAWIGDIVLLFYCDIAFLLGLSSFLIMQGLYTWSFLRQRESFHILHAVCLMILLSYVAFFNILLWNKSAQFQYPVVIYSTVIALMVFAAFMRNHIVPGFSLVLIGAGLFLISDSLLAADKFIMPLSKSSFWVMSSYILAQFLIVKGYCWYRI